MKIEAAIARADQSDFSIEPVEIAEPRADEILVEIAGVGICHTDIFFKAAAPSIFKQPIVLGHEGAGTVVAVGSDITKVAVGDKVALSFRYCGDRKSVV